MLRIGLTGGLGSGKSTIARIFEVLGIPVYYADAASKRILEEDTALRSAVAAAFGRRVYEGGRLDRKYLASQVFNDETKLNLLNSLVHPATIRDAEIWMATQNAPYIIKEAALIFESGSQRSLDLVIGVKAPLALRLQRAMKRDGISRGEALSRVNKQLDEDMKMRLCDHVILNDEMAAVIPQVLALHEKFLN